MPLIKGATYVLRGFALIRHPQLRRFVTVPLAINTVLFAALIWLGYGQFDRLMVWLDDWVGRSLDLPGWLDWLEPVLQFLWAFLEVVITILFILGLLFVVVYTFTVVANLIAAPFNSLLAEKTEQHLLGRTPTSAGDWKTLLKSIGPTIWSEVLKLWYFVTRAIPLLILFLIPGINVTIAPVAWFVFGAWMLALEYMDYPMGNHEILFRQQRRELRSKRFLGLGFGSLTLGLTMVPVINFLAMPVAVTGATAMFVENWRALAASNH